MVGGYTRTVRLLRQDEWARPWLRQRWRLLTLVVVCGILTVLCGGALMFTSGYLISRSATHPYNLLAVYVPVVLTRTFGIGRPVFRYLERLLSHDWVLRMTSGLRRQLYEVLEKDAIFFSQRHRVGDLLGLLADDIDHLQNMYLQTIFPGIVALVIYVTLAAGFGLMSPVCGLLLAVLLGLIVFAAPLVSLHHERIRKKQQKQLQAEMYRALTDAITGAYDWLISGRARDFMQLSAEPARHSRASQRCSQQFARRRNFVLHVLFVLSIAAVALWSSRYFGGSQAEANWVAACTLLLFPLFDTLSAVSQGLADWPVYETSLQRLNGLQPTPDLLPSQVDIPSDWQELRLSRAAFAYGDSAVLQGVDLTVPRGSKLAVLGRSGTGKSTLLKLISGDIAPLKGTVQLGGADVRSLRAHQAELFGVLDQQPFLFNTSLVNNVRLGNLMATHEQCRWALEQAGLGELIASLPQGLQTAVQENGARFSGGEQQRIALARLLVQDVPVVILDEPTVGLDPLTEQALLETIFEVCRHKTVLWVTHHLRGIDAADNVVFLRDGQVVLQGSPATLHKTSAWFRRLYQLDYGQTTLPVAHVRRLHRQSRP